MKRHMLEICSSSEDLLIYCTKSKCCSKTSELKHTHAGEGSTDFLWSWPATRRKLRHCCEMFLSGNPESRWQPSCCALHGKIRRRCAPIAHSSGHCPWPGCCAKNVSAWEQSCSFLSLVSPSGMLCGCSLTRNTRNTPTQVGRYVVNVASEYSPHEEMWMGHLIS